MNSPSLNYQSLLAETDKESKNEYNVDPRVALYASRNTTNDAKIESYNKSARLDDYLINQPEPYEDDRGDIVQQEPPMIDSKHIVIVDTAQRDWTIQPDTFSTVFSFINPSPMGPTQYPYYYNNSVVPFSAYDMPDPNSSFYIRNNANFLPNTRPKIIDPTTGGIITVNQSFQNKGLLAQTWGWRLVISGTTGLLKHYDASDPSTFIQSNDRIIYYPVFDATQTRGSLIGTEPAPNTQSLVKNSFGTQLALSNIRSIKLARATLPIRRFDSYDPVIYGDSSANFAPGTVLNTFHTEPYVLMSINNLTGQYYGASPVVHNSFSALVQQQRSAIDTTNSSVFAQYQDYYPWSEEAFQFIPPLAQLSNTAISLSNSFGQAYTHLDDLNVTTLIFGETTAIQPSSQVGLISFLVTRNRSDPTINISGNTCNWFFASNDIRPGDQLSFYNTMANRIQNDPSCTPAVSNLFNYLQNNGTIVTKVSLISNANIPVIDVAYTFEAVVNTRSVDETYALYSTCLNPIIDEQSPLPRFVGISGELSKFNGLKYLSLCASNTVISPTIGVITLCDVLSPSAFYPLPTLNRNCQCTFAFEIVTTEGDTSAIKKITPTK